MQTSGNGIYIGQVDIHEENLVNPQDPEVHVQNNVNIWMRA